MKKLILPIIFFSLFSCSDLKEIPKPNFAFEKYLDSIKSIDSLWQENTAVRESVNKAIKKDLVLKIDKGLFDDYPLEIDRINECNGKYYLELDNYYHLNKFRGNFYYNINDARFDFVGEVSKEEAFKLKEKSIIKVKFKFAEYINFKNNDKYCKYVLMSPFIGLESGMTVTKSVEFGAIAIKIDSISSYNEPL